MKNLILSIVSILFFTCLNATTFYVSNTNNSGSGSLRDKISSASNGDVIRFNSSLISSGSATITLTSEIAFNKGLKIVGLYNATDTLYISGGNNSRIFKANMNSATNKNLILDSLVLINGQVSNYGGAVNFSNGNTLSIKNSIIKNNNTYNNGGGIYALNSLLVLIKNSKINGNTAGISGGGVKSESSNSSPVSCSIKLVNSTVSGNSALYGGGVMCSSRLSSSVKLINSTVSGNSTQTLAGVSSFSSSTSTSDSSSVILINSTITGNTASSQFGGIRCGSINHNSAGSALPTSFCSVRLINSTVSGNSAPYHAGIHCYASNTSSPVQSIHLKSSIVAFNGNSFNTGGTAVTSGGYNIFSDSNPGSTTTGDQTGVTTAQLNLGPLAYNQGTTKTLLPSPSSVAVDNGNPVDMTDAQNAPISGTRDVGAAEYDCFVSVKMVTNTNNAGAGSLRNIIGDACNGDTIRFTPSLIASGSTTITLTSEINFSKSLIIIGLYNATDTLKISGGNTNGIFIAEMGSAEEKNLFLDSLVLMNGSISSGGGAIRFRNGDSLVVKNSVIRGNEAVNNGGGIYTISSSLNYTVIVDNTIIDGNTTQTQNGGGIYTFSSSSSSPLQLEISNSILKNNIAIADGGGIYFKPDASTASCNITNSIISNNTSYYGGGIYFQIGDSLKINNSTIDGNTAHVGAGIYSSSSSVAINNSTINNNVSNFIGGGIYSDSVSVALTNSTLSGNTTSTKGGGIRINNNSSLVAINSTITGNTAGSSGGGIAASSSTIDLTSCIVALNGSSNIDDDGLGITSGGYNVFSDAPTGGTATGDQINITTAQLNLGTLANNGGTTNTILPLFGSVAINNGNPADLSDAQNGAIINIRDVGAGESPCYVGVKMVSNTSNNGTGSLRNVIANACEGDTIRFDPSLISSGNTIITLTSEIGINKNLTIIGLYNATDTLKISGGNSNRIFNVDLSTSSIKDLILKKLVLINGNASGNGGAVNFINSDILYLSNSIIKGNKASNKGGGIFGSSQIIINNSTISNNTTLSSGGGGIYTTSLLLVFNSTINGNTAQVNGGGIASKSSQGVSITNSTITGNTATTGSGGGIFSSTQSSSFVTLTNSTISGNNAANTGGGIHSNNATIDINITSSIVALNGSSNIYNVNPITIVSGGYNIFRYSPTGSTGTGDQTNITSAQLNLGTLADNGGTTKTILPLFGSVALNNGDPTDISDAQNGSIIGTRDVGAAEAPCYVGVKMVSNTNNNGAGSLRNLITNACEGDTIRFEPSLISSGSATITLTSQIFIYKKLTIIGLYNATDSLKISGGNTNRIFNVDLSTSSNKNLILDSLVLIKGYSFSGGAVRFTYGDTLYVSNSIISRNTAQSNGGAIASHSSQNVNISNSTISGNTANYGGGIYSHSNSYSLSVYNSTISGNTANQWGGGIYANSSLLVSNSTITGNTAQFLGGGIASNSSQDVNITNSTISGNTANTGGGIHSNNGTIDINITSSIVALNGSSNISNLNPTTIVSGGYNIFSDAPTGSTGTGDQTNISSVQLNLGGLADNGGVTKTLVPLFGSTAINNGNPSDLSDSQNGSIIGTRDVGSAESCQTGSTDIQTACDTYVWIDGNTYTASNNSVTHTLTNVAGCDSIVTLDLTINNSSTSTDVQTECDSYLWIDGNTYTASNNTATYTLSNTAGCDSIITLDLTINNSTTSTDVQLACDTYTWIDGNTYTASNNSATHTLNTSNGCDSVVTLNLTINNSNTGIDVQTACDTYTWIDGNTYTTSNSTATHTLTNAAGCDSIVTLDLTINNSNTGTDVQTACDSYLWINGNTYTASNNSVTHTLTNAAGCDSIVTLDLTINNSSTSTDTQIACDTYAWIDGNTYTTSNNTATHTLSTSNGCDSVVTLDLTINSSNTGTDVQTACDSYVWIDGNTYTTSNNSAMYTLTNAVGCDSVVTLDLTINNSSTGTDVQTACDTYTWIDGNTYTTSNSSAIYTLANAVGCDSVITLDLTINTSTASTDVQLACGAYTWIDGNTYTTNNNTATHTLSTSNGCDSIVTLDLTINSSNTGTDVQTICDTYTWIDGNTYTASNNSATYTLTNAAGCDSIVTLDLTITYSSTSTDVQTACDTYTWMDGNTYTASSNTVTYILTNAVGCDSVITLDLTITNSTASTDVQTVCDTYTWIDGNTYTVSNNTATYMLTNAIGCDSIITLDLTVIDSDLTVTVSGGGISLTSNEPGVAYKWLDCNNGYAEMAGETSQTFTATINGDYAVEITNGNCVDTSMCTIVSTVDIEDYSKTDFAIVYPNPTSDVITISLSGLENIQFELMDVQGKIIISELVINNGEKVDMRNLESGIYFVRLVSNEKRMVKRVVKN